MEEWLQRYIEGVLYRAAKENGINPRLLVEMYRRVSAGTWPPPGREDWPFQLVENVLYRIAKSYGLDPRLVVKSGTPPARQREPECRTVTCVGERYGWDDYLRQLAKLCNNKLECVKEALDYVRR